MRLASINTRNGLAQLLGIEIKELTYVLYKEKVDFFYTTFSIPKKSGGQREINAPKGKLKFIQKRLKQVLETDYNSICTEYNLNTNVAHAFKKGRGIITNARVHRNKKYIINVDLESFFDSFNFGRVRGYFIKSRYWSLDPTIATLIAQITCYKNVLPQGAPTSPIITNLICNVMDWYITQLAKKYKLSYTRYADDMTFATNDNKIVENFNTFLEELKEEVEKNGFKLNESKTRFTDCYKRQEVTGLIVNKKVSVKREYYKNTHAMANTLYRTKEYTIDGNNGTLNQLEGRFTFIDQIDKYNNSIDGVKHHTECLSRREKKYQEFLFYKYFCVNMLPLVLTEGKTDKIYIKTALRSLSSKYNHFISNKDDKYEYKVSFLKRSSRLEYLFGINKDGAAPLTNVIKLYKNTEKSNNGNYAKKLIERYNVVPNSPVILLYDNEFDEKDSPIKQLIRGQKIDEDKLKKELFVRLVANLYVQVIPITDGKKKCEIEDLLGVDVDKIIIDGRKFDRKGKKNKEEYYNKDIFSHYVEQHESDFDYSGFVMLFDTWDKIMDDYKLYRERMLNTEG